jgi:hypothetical protein
MELDDIEKKMACLDTVYRPVATKPVDIGALFGATGLNNLGASIEADMAQLGVGDQAEMLLRELVELYAAVDDKVRLRIRGLFDRYSSFRWAAHLPREWNRAEEFRARLIHLSMRDQASDARDEIVTLQSLCSRARQAGIDVDPILDEVAAMSSDVDRYGMGSMRAMILR